MEHKVGDYVKIVSNKSDHGFEIGTPVKIIEVNPSGNDGEGEYVAKDDNNWWWLKPSDVKNI